MPTTWTRSSALQALADAVSTGRLDRVRAVGALDHLARSTPDGEVVAAVARFAEAMLDGAFGDRRHADLLESCVRLLSRVEDRRALPVYRKAAVLLMPSPRGDLACNLRGAALAAMHAVAPTEARWYAVRLVAGPRAESGEPARTAIAALGAAGEDAALLLASRTLLDGEVVLVVAALREMSSDVPVDAFWEVAAPLVGDRFTDSVLAITDLIVEGRRGDLLPGFAVALVEVSDPDLWRAVLLSLLGSRLDGVEAVFSAGVENAPARALPGVEEALMLARLARQDELLRRLSERARRGS